MSGNAAEAALQANNHQRLRQAYQGKVPETSICENAGRLSEPGTLSSVLNWYWALDFGRRTGKIRVPTLYIWGSADQELGETTALGTAEHVTASFGFKKLEGRSPWLVEVVPDEVSALLLEHLAACRAHKSDARHSLESPNTNPWILSVNKRLSDFSGSK